jgi:excinuclease ABC subunit A
MEDNIITTVDPKLTHSNKHKKEAISNTNNIEIFGAREHNLKNINLEIPRNKLVVITGVSGSGKSSLAFDTIYAEGQRRYMESFIAYVRNFLGNMQRPDVDKIEGLSPVIAIEQKTTSRNPKSTVGTTTDIYDFMRLLFAKCADAFSYLDGKQLIKQNETQIFDFILKTFDGKKLILLAPIVKSRKGHYKELFAKILKSGFNKVRIDNKFETISPALQLDRYKTHDIEVLIDTLVVCDKEVPRLKSSLATAWTYGKKNIILLDETNNPHYFSQNFMDPDSGLSYEDPSPNTFSFNSPYGACVKCQGLGEIVHADYNALMPNKGISIAEGAILPLGPFRNISFFDEISDFLSTHGFKLNTPISKIPDNILEKLLYGEVYRIPTDFMDDFDLDLEDVKLIKFDGVLNFLIKQQEKSRTKSDEADYNLTCVCPECNGQRLRKESLHFKINKTSISELANMNLKDLYFWFSIVESTMTEKQRIISNDILVEIRKRLQLLLDMGLDYLHLNRSLNTLSGGESQRVRLATQIGTQLVGVLYILDEPSIGLHQRDNRKLIDAMKALRDLGNSVIVVEHDKEIMLNADYIIDIGPGAGINGGNVVAAGDVQTFLKQKTNTAEFLSNKISIPMPEERRKGSGKWMSIMGCNGYNLKNIDLRIPLETLICITGLSGSGKSSLIHSTLIPALKNHLYKSSNTCLPYATTGGFEHIDSLVEVDQSPIGRTPRSNPATYTGIFNAIRTFFSQLPEAKIRGYSPGRFSFNVKGGRCNDCEGGGMKLISMSFLEDVYIPCDTCRAKRYNRETLEVKYHGCSISDVLDMTIDKAIVFFSKHPQILKKLNTLQEVGLGYITLGQHATTLSGGEAQRVKLATELSKRGISKTLYVLDEPSTGLHFSDIAKLMGVINRLVNLGNTVLIVEHNLDIIKTADYVIDLGPESGPRGGHILTQGTPEEVAKCMESFTAKFLKEELNFSNL